MLEQVGPTRKGGLDLLGGIAPDNKRSHTMSETKKTAPRPIDILTMEDVKCLREAKVRVQWPREPRKVEGNKVVASAYVLRPGRKPQRVKVILGEVVRDETPKTDVQTTQVA